MSEKIIETQKVALDFIKEQIESEQIEKSPAMISALAELFKVITTPN